MRFAIRSRQMTRMQTLACGLCLIFVGVAPAAADRTADAPASLRMRERRVAQSTPDQPPAGDPEPTPATDQPASTPEAAAPAAEPSDAPASTAAQAETEAAPAEEVIVVTGTLID